MKRMPKGEGEGWYIVDTIEGPRIHIKRQTPDNYIMGPFSTYLQADSAFEGWQKRLRDKAKMRDFTGTAWIIFILSALIWWMLA
jgi:hypothetical protein